MQKRKSIKRNIGIKCGIREGDSFNATIIVRRHNPSHTTVKQVLKRNTNST
jgi:hypothetical protein